MKRAARYGARRLTLLAAPIAFALVLSACAPGGTTDDTASPDDSTNGDSADGEQTEGTGATSLRVTVWTGNEDHLALFDEIADDFIAQHDTVEEVTFEVIPFDNYIEATTVQLAGGNPPDLGWILERNGPEFVEAGVLADIGSELRDDEEYDFDDVEESALSLWQHGEAVYGYPFSTSPFAMFYNADMFADAGRETPDELLAAGNWTWEAAGDAAEQVVAAGAAPHGLIVRDFDFELWDSLAGVWRGFGADAWSEDGTECRMDEPEMVEAMTWFHELVFEREGHPRPGQGADFFAGDSAMTVTQISRASLLEEDGFEWGLVPLPAGPAGDAQVVGQAAIGVFSASEAVPEATEFLKFWTNEESSRKMAQFFPPPRASLLTAEIMAATNPLLTEEQLQSVVIDGIASGQTVPSHANFAQLRDTIRAEMDALWDPGADVSAVLSSTCEAAQPLRN
jgi:multiple sugar transport system substrate-binding protein